MYNGLAEITLNDGEIADFYQHKNINNRYNLVKNQYLILKDENGDIVDKYKWNGENLVGIKYRTIRSQMLGEIKPKNIKQQCCFDLLDDDSIKIKMLIGNAGVGKSFLATNWIVEKLNNGDYQKLVVLRNNINVRGVKDIGYRKGDTDQKLDGYIAFLKDIMSLENFEQLKFENRLETPFLGEIRSRSFSDSICYCPEFQNTNVELAKTIITRVGEGSILICDGDLDQIDSTSFEGDRNGLSSMCKYLAGEELFGAVEMDKCERSAIARLAEKIK